jgi:transcriptional regulator with XRE-family HTH domain
MKWYDVVKGLMVDKKIRQDDLISVFGVKTRGAVGHYLSGRRKPSAEQLKALADRFGLTLDDLMDETATGQGEKAAGRIEANAAPALSPRQQAFLDLISSLPTLEQDKLMRELEEKERYFREVYEDMKRKAG